MKTKLALVRGLFASLLLTLGFARFADRIDPIMDQLSASNPTADTMTVAGNCSMPCVDPNNRVELS